MSSEVFDGLNETFCGMGSFEQGHLISWLERTQVEREMVLYCWDIICQMFMRIGEQDEINRIMDYGWPTVLGMADKEYCSG